MLSSREQELLAAYVDGELTPQQNRQVAELLERSAKARTLLAQLEADSRELQAMPVLPAPVDLAECVLDRIALAPRPVLRHPRPAAAHLPGRFSLGHGFAAAAAVLLVVGLGSFFLNQPDPPAPGEVDQTVAHNDIGRSRPLEAPTPGPEVAHEKPTPPRDKGSRMASREKGPSLLPREPQTEDPRPPDEPGMADPDRPDDRIMTSPGRDTAGRFDRVELALPTLHKLHALDKPIEARGLLQELNAGQAYRIEILARDASRGFPGVEKALAGRKVSLVFDPPTATRLKKPQWRTDVALFTENITPADLVAILRDIGAADRLAGAKKPSEMRFDGSLVVKALSAWDRRELTELLSVDPVKVRPVPAPPRPVDIRRPLPDQTADQVAAALQGKGVPRPGTTRNGSAYVTALSGPRGRSLDLNHFLASRQPAHPGTLQVFLVLRNVAP